MRFGNILSLTHSLTHSVSYHCNITIPWPAAKYTLFSDGAWM